MQNRMDVLDKGFVELVDSMGDDYSILRSARVSTGADISKGDEKDRKLIRYLWMNKHSSPFEFCEFVFHLKCPIFVQRQIVRHRVFSMNESSARYKEFHWETYLPEEWRGQDSKNKQMSVELDELDQDIGTEQAESAYAWAEESYYNMLNADIAREQARMVMPVGQYTEFYWKANLRNLFHFLSLRDDDHAQWETRQYAIAIKQLLREQKGIRWSMEVFEEVDRLEKMFREALTKYKNVGLLEDYLTRFNKA